MQSPRDRAAVRGLPPSLLLRTSNAQCTTDGFHSFLQRWSLLTKHYNYVYLYFYHIDESGCVLKTFNCMLLGGWTLNGTRTVVPRSLSHSPPHIEPSAVLFACDSRSSYATAEPPLFSNGALVQSGFTRKNRTLTGKVERKNYVTRNQF